MFAATTELVDAQGQRIAIQRVFPGRQLLGKKGQALGTSEVKRCDIRRGKLSVILVTAYGRRLKCSGDQQVLVKLKPGVGMWKPARNIRVGDRVTVADGGILAVDRVTCVVMAANDDDLWLTVTTENKTLFAEEILCRAS